MPHLYSIGYTSEEDSGSIELSHPNKFSHKEFKKIIVDAVMDILVLERDPDTLDYVEGEIRKEEREWITEHFEQNRDKNGNFGDFPTLSDYMEACAYKWYTTFADIHEEIAKKLVEKYGFSYVIFTQAICANGWAGIVDKKRQFGEEDPLLNAIRDKFWEETNDLQ